MMKKIFDWVVYILTAISFLAILLSVLVLLYSVIYVQFESVVGTIFALIAVIVLVTLPFYRKRLR